MKVFILSMLVLSMFGCAMTTVHEYTAQGKKVKLSKNEPRTERCQSLGDVSGSAKSRNAGEGTKYARIDIRNNTAAIGGNFVRIDSVVAANAKDFTGRAIVSISGIAYKCK